MAIKFSNVNKADVVRILFGQIYSLTGESNLAWAVCQQSLICILGSVSLLDSVLVHAVLDCEQSLLSAGRDWPGRLCWEGTALQPVGSSGTVGSQVWEGSTCRACRYSWHRASVQR